MLFNDLALHALFPKALILAVYDSDCTEQSTWEEGKNDEMEWVYGVLED